MWDNTAALWRCRGPGGPHRLQNGWGVARRGPWWVRLPYASATYFLNDDCDFHRLLGMESHSIACSEKVRGGGQHLRLFHGILPALPRNIPALPRKKSGDSCVT